MYICICNAVTEKQVRACVDAGATSLEDLHIDLGVASCCGRCAVTAVEYLPGGRCAQATACSGAGACGSAPVPHPVAQPLHFTPPSHVTRHGLEQVQTSLRRTALAA